MERFAVNATVTLGLFALAGLRALTHVNDWLRHETLPRKQQILNPREVHVSAVPLDPEVIYERCACANGRPCAECWDGGVRPHQCGAA